MKVTIRKTVYISLISFIGIFLFIILFFILTYVGVFGPLPTSEELKKIHNEEASLVFSSDGELLGKYFAENRTNIGIEEIPNHLIQALVATEDKRFFEHQGYDIRSYFRVVFKTLLLGNKSSGGGSTITQQLVKNLYGRNQHSFLSMPVSKLKEAIIATRMEEVYSKEDILALYLNSVPFGEQVFGIEAAAIRYFGKSAYELNIQESAVLVGILKANTYYNPRMNPENAISRRNQIISLLHQQDFLSKTEKDSLQNTPLNLSYSNYSLYSPASYFTKQVKEELKDILEFIPRGDHWDFRKDGLQIYTSLNLKIQEEALASRKIQLQKMQILLDKQLRLRKEKEKFKRSLETKYSKKQLEQVSKREVFDWEGIVSKDMSLVDSIWHYRKMLHSAILITEAHSGRIISWVGGNHFRYLPYDMIYAKRQAASALKPLIYAAALEQDMDACSYLENTEKVYENYQNWKPQNYNRQQTPDSTVALWYALSNSMNLPTVDLYFKTGHENTADLLRRFGFKPPLNETPSLSLGAMDVSLYEMTQAYTALANGGVYYDKLSLIDSICDGEGKLLYKNPYLAGREVIANEVTQELNEILQAAINKGTGRAIRSRFDLESELAGKTGTAQNYSNAWFMSFTHQLVIGVWVGASSPEVHFYNGLGSGSALALPISGNIWKTLESDSYLKEEYLQAFPHDSLILASILCPAYKEKGVDGFVHRLFDGEEKPNDKIKKDSTGDISRKDKRKAKKEARKKRKKEKSKVGKFFQRIFNGKDK